MIKSVFIKNCPELSWPKTALIRTVLTCNCPDWSEVSRSMIPRLSKWFHLWYDLELKWERVIFGNWSVPVFRIKLMFKLKIEIEIVIQKDDFSFSRITTAPNNGCPTPCPEKFWARTTNKPRTRMNSKSSVTDLDKPKISVRWSLLWRSFWSVESRLWTIIESIFIILVRNRGQGQSSIKQPLVWLSKSRHFCHILRHLDSRHNGITRHIKNQEPITFACSKF